MKDVLKPKPKEEVIEAIKNLAFPSYRLSSFLKIMHTENLFRNDFNLGVPLNGKNIEIWCEDVFHTPTKDMEVRQFHDSNPFYRILQKAIGNDGHSFASNLNIRLLRIGYGHYYAYPKNELENILIKYL